MVNNPNDVDLLDVDVGRLIADARLLQRHLADSGKLRDTTLGDAIAALSRDRGTPDAANSLAALSVEYSKAINLTEKTSIEELRKADARLYPNRWINLREAVTASLAIILIFFAVLGFVIVQDLNDNIAQLQRINLQNPLQKLTELRRIIDEGALNNPKSAYYLQYLKAHHEVSLLFDSANQILERTAASSQRRSRNGDDPIANDNEIGIANQIYNIILFELTGPASPVPVRAPPPMSLSELQAPAASNAPALPGMTGIVASLPTSATLTASTGGGTIEGIYDTSVPHIDEKNCKPYNDTPVRKLVGGENQQFLKAALDKFDDFCLAQTLDIRIGTYRPAAAIHTVRVLQDQLFMIGVLFLPLIGGLLGATISIIYAIINNTRSGQLSAGYMAVRIIVGGAFGVIIGWFSATGSSDSTDFIQHVSGTPFTLAILAGFSVQLLSAVLMTFSSSFEKQSATERPRKGRQSMSTPKPSPPDDTSTAVTSKLSPTS
jgi:hypothetical protein